MELTVTLLFNCLGLAVGTGLGTLVQQRQRYRRMAIAGILTVALGAFAPGLSTELPLTPLAGMQPISGFAHLIPRLSLLVVMLGLAWLNRWLAMGALIALYGV